MEKCKLCAKAKNIYCKRHAPKMTVKKIRMSQEICICAAIKTATGFIIRGHRHCDAIRTASGIKALTMTEIQSAEQGFIISTNRFVDRKEGCRLQKEAGIISADTQHPYLHGELYSEDLY